MKFVLLLQNCDWVINTSVLRWLHLVMVGCKGCAIMHVFPLMFLAAPNRHGLCLVSIFDSCFLEPLYSEAVLKPHEDGGPMGEGRTGLIFLWCYSRKSSNICVLCLWSLGSERWQYLLFVLFSVHIRMQLVSMSCTNHAIQLLVCAICTSLYDIGMRPESL